MARRQGETSYKETAFGIIPRTVLIPLEIEGIKRAWDFVLKKSEQKFVITPRLLQQVHRVGFGWIFPKMGGRFRTIDVRVSRHQPPKFYVVPQLMLDFCRDLGTRLRHLSRIDQAAFLQDLLSLLAWAHHRFLWIHPFQDYNGRIARLLINMILLKLDLPPIEMKIETKTGRKRYILALQTADTGDLQKLEELILSAVKEAGRGQRR